MATQLLVWQDAARILADARFASISDDIPSRYRFDDTWSIAINRTLKAAPWRFATIVSIPSSGGSPATGYTYSFSRPAAWLRTLALYANSGSRECPIDVREFGSTHWSSNYTPIVARYISNVYVDPASWPDEFAMAVAARLAMDAGRAVTGASESSIQYLNAVWEARLGDAAAVLADPENPWIDAQLGGILMPNVRATLEKGTWKFAMVTADIATAGGTASEDYTYRFTKPASALRIVDVYRTLGGGQWEALDYRDEGGYLHANYTPITVRYVSSTLGEDPTKWSNLFEKALLAEIALYRALSRPGTAGAQIQALSMAAKMAYDEARVKDDLRERPKVHTVATITKARFGSYFLNKEQGY